MSYARTFFGLGAVATALFATMIGVLTVPVAASAATVPFSDPYASGYLGFCDSGGHQIRSGSTTTAPFVWRVVSSTPAPAGYGPADGGRGTLAAYQPRKGVDPGDWSGKQMTASSPYSNGDAPMSAGSPLDPALVDFIGNYPLTWDGLAQLRLLITAPNKPEHTQPYAAAVIRVTGSRWTQVGGGSVNCSAGKVISPETIGVPAKTLHSLAARSTPGATPSATRGAPAGHGSTAPGHGGATPASGGSTGATASGSGTATNGSSDPSPVSASVNHSSGGMSMWWIAVIVVIAAPLAGGFIWRRRRAHGG